jgi:hypothetical protein
VAQAIESLILSDAKLRTNNPEARLSLVGIIASVRENGGTVRICASSSIAGEKLEQFSGIVAQLRFPLYDFANEASASEDDAAPEDGPTEVLPDELLELGGKIVW